MHHEVLLAAVGCPGDIIRPTGHGGASSSSLYAVAPDVSFLSPGTRVRMFVCVSLLDADVCICIGHRACVCGSIGVINVFAWCGRV